MSDECQVSADCGRLNTCDFEENECVHNDVFPITATVEVIAYILIPIMLGFQNVAGLGAGPIKIYILMMLLNYSLTQSTSHNFPFLLGAKLADVILNIRKPHPVLKNTLLINFNIILIFFPSILMGSAIGSMFNPVLPSLSISILIVIFISFSFVKTMKKVKIFYEKRKKEILQQQNDQQQANQIMQEPKQQNDNDALPLKINQQEEKSRQTSQQYSPERCKETTGTAQNLETKDQDHNGEKNSHQNAYTQNYTENKNSEQQNIVENNNKDNSKDDNSTKIKQEDLDLFEQYKENQSKLPMNKIAVLFGLLFAIFVIYALQGTRRGDSFIGVETCSAPYWIIFVLQFPIFGLFFIIIRKIIEREENLLKRVNYQKQEFEVRITEYGVTKFIIFGFFCGFVIGLVGFGGGILIVPIMLNLGLHPRSATSTTSILIAFSAVTGIIISLIDRQLKIEALAFFFGLSFIGGLFFTVMFNKIVDRYKLGSLTIGFTAFIQCALLVTTIGLLISDLISKDFSELTETDSICE